MTNTVKRYSYGFHADGFGEGRTLGLIEKEDGNLVRYEDYELLREERDSFQRVGILATEERDALRAELAITRRVIDRIGQLCTTPHESKERFIRRVQSVIEWERAAQQDQPK